MFDNLEKEFYERLYAEHGPLMWCSPLIKTLGYKNNAAFRQSVYRNKCAVKVFDIVGRQGRFAHTHSVATWLATLVVDNE